MVLKQFAYLLALVRERHFGRAAVAAHVSQPTLSAAIRNLEAELGVPIVERGHSFRGFTQEGLVVIEHAKRVMAECAAMTQHLGELGGGLTGRLRVGAVPTALPVISHLIAPFYARSPQVSVTILSLTSDEIVRGLENFELDAGVSYLDNEPLQAVRAKPVYQETYAFLTSLDGPYAGRDEISWSEAAEAPLCLLTPDMQNRRIIDGVFRSVGKAPAPEVETNSIFNLCSHAASSRWSSIVPYPLLYFFGIPPNTKYLRLIEPEASRTMGVIIADREPVSPLAKALFSVIQPLDPGAVLEPPVHHPGLHQ